MTTNPMQKTMRTVRSFVRREGRITAAQKQALTECWPSYGLEMQATPYDWNTVFERSADTILEIGFGQGASLFTMVEQNPEQNYVGVEVHRPGVGNLLVQANKHHLTNLKIFCADVKEVLSHSIAANSLHKIYVLFPDPWHKKRHHKRRLLQTDFIETLVSKLQPNGILHIATDWENYAQHIAEVLDANPNLVKRPTEASARPSTKYEKRGKRLGHDVFDFVYGKNIVVE